jgi:hypothetical protein
MGNMEPKCWFTAEMAPQRSSVRKEIELAGGGAMFGLVDLFVANL